MSKFELSEIQARAILDMRLQKLTGLERDKLRAEYDELMTLIADLKDILDAWSVAWTSSRQSFLMSKNALVTSVVPPLNTAALTSASRT